MWVIFYFLGMIFVSIIIQGLAAVLGHVPVYKIIFLDPETNKPLSRGMFEGQPCVYGQIAIGDAELQCKLSGRFAAVKIPKKPWPIRLKRYFFPLEDIDIPVEGLNAIWEEE